MEKIWVEKNWYIPVNKEGYVIGPCFEGMLGCVLQLKREKTNATAAMKIPRLLADTIEENAYIFKMTEDEVTAVAQIVQAGGREYDLLGAQFLGDDPLLGRRSTDQSVHREAQKQHGHVVFVHFERDQKPRFCSVKFTNDGLSVFPLGCKEVIENNIEKEDWDYFIALTGRQNLPDFLRTMYRLHYLEDDQADEEKEIHRGELGEALGMQRIASIWYAAVPSIVFDWAEGNLQEAITKQEIKEWTLDNHFTLFEKVLNGVRFLHEQQMIHGDIRPANVMRIGPQEPQHYKLGDYGSYGKEWQAIGDQGRPGGLTQIGPAIGRMRETPFYSKERRAGIEFESANTAIISRFELSNPPGGFNYILLLGWRSDLLSNDGSVKQEIKESIQDIKKNIKPEKHNLTKKQLAGSRRSAENFATDQLQLGDRIRLRNYLFEILQTVKTADDLKYYLCTGRYAEIIHDHLIVYKDDDPIEESAVIDLANYVEFHQWSAATDLYGVGALCLYCLFSCGLQRQYAPIPATITNNYQEQTERPTEEEGDGNSSQVMLEQVAVNSKDPDTLFVDMIRILESIPYFQFFWKEVERFRKEIEELYDKNPRPTSQEAADHKVLTEDSPEGQNLYDMALYTTNNILQSTPKARVILEQFEMNLAYFLLFMHFVLACLHRQSHMKTKDETLFKPFARDRVEIPEGDAAAFRAWERLRKIKSLLTQDFFSNFKCKDEKQILDFNPRSDFQLRIELEKVMRENFQSSSELERLKGELRGLANVGFLRSHWSLRSELKDLVTKYDRKTP